VLHLHPLGHVDETAAGEHGAVEGRELVVGHRDHLAEPLAEDLRVLFQPVGAVDEHHALLGHGLLDVRVGGLGIVLGLDPGEELAFLLGHTEPLEGALDVVRHLVPRPFRPLAVREVVADPVEIDRLEVAGGPVRRHGLAVEDAEGPVAEFTDPVGVVLRVADVVDRPRAQAETGIELVPLGEVEVADAVLLQGDPFDHGRLVVQDRGPGGYGGGVVVHARRIQTSALSSWSPA